MLWSMNFADIWNTRKKKNKNKNKKQKKNKTKQNKTKKKPLLHFVQQIDIVRFFLLFE